MEMIKHEPCPSSDSAHQDCKLKQSCDTDGQHERRPSFVSAHQDCNAEQQIQCQGSNLFLNSLVNN